MTQKINGQSHTHRTKKQKQKELILYHIDEIKNPQHIKAIISENIKKNNKEKKEHPLL